MICLTGRYLSNLLALLLLHSPVCTQGHRPCNLLKHVDHNNMASKVLTIELEEPASVILCCSTYLMSLSAATSIGILSSWLIATRLAPWSRRKFIIFRLPQLAAAWSGVQPSMSLDSRSAANSTKSCARFSDPSSMQHYTNKTPQAWLDMYKMLSSNFLFKYKNSNR